MLNAVIYARFSSDMQREESIDAQVRACKAYAKSKGYTVVKEYVDEAKSGRSTLTRDAYNQMMADAMENKFDVIIFHKIDRNSRNELNYFIFKDKLEKLGIRYEYAAQPIDTDSPEGQVMETVMVGMAAYYSRNLAKETKKGMNENAYKAIFNGGYAPLGYKIVDKHYVVDEKEAEAVRLIFNLYLDGKDTAKSAWHSPHVDTLHVAEKTFRRTVCMIFSVMSGIWERIHSIACPKQSAATAIPTHALTILSLSPTLFLPLFQKKPFWQRRRRCF